MQFNHIKAVVFDLDDTLYPEIQYVNSGFRAVSDWLYKMDLTTLSSEECFAFMQSTLKAEGRGKVFDRLISLLDLSVEKYLHTLIYIYRTHLPSDLVIWNEMAVIILSLKQKGMKLGIVTDGIYVTQKTKTDLLLKELPFDAIVHTDSLGFDKWKPCITPFQVVCNLLAISPMHAVYVGDNPVKDFAGANRIGMQTIWYNPHKKTHHFEHPDFKPDLEISKPQSLIEIIYELDTYTK
jgi:putative hydrolase of the HAD superfamily